MNALGRRILPLTALLLAIAGPAWAQCDWRFEADRAEAMIDRAREPVERSGFPEARELLSAAEDRLRQCHDRGRRGEGEFACRLARVSQGLAGKAGEIAIRGVRGLEQLERMLEGTDEMLQDARARLRGEDERAGRGFLKSAREQQDGAWAAFRNRRPRMALKLTLMARESVQRALRRPGGRAQPDPGQVVLEVDQTDRLLEETRRILGEESAGFDRLQLRNAERLQEQAKRRMDRGQPGLALGLTREARATIRRALGDADVEPDPGDVQLLLETTAELLDRLGSAAVEARHERALDLLSRAGALLEDARRGAGAARWRDALASARAASALALDASDLLEQNREE